MQYADSNRDPVVTRRQGVDKGVQDRCLRLAAGMACARDRGDFTAAASFEHELMTLRAQATANSTRGQA